MSNAERYLAYVKDVVKGAESAPSGPRAIYILWAVIYFTGFSLFDWNHRYAGIFWLIAGPIGGVVSFWLGSRSALRAGVASRRMAKRHMLHWIGTGAAIFMALPLLWLGVLSSTALIKVILLIMALGMFTAGIYLVRPYLWVGLALAACYLAVMTLSALPWMVVGALSGGTMLLAAFLGERSSDQP
ncbi:MAG: hypothetical protein IIA05_12205 [Proteobacteria bacterium]|nr:hypothetical protein [Pseudomonadota bacterium]